VSDPDKRLKEWADAMMNQTGSTVPPVHHTDCTIYECHKLCDVKWTYIMHQVGGNMRWVVDDMNAGNVDPEDVYPRGRYQGD
jgi:hypothetical protein